MIYVLMLPTSNMEIFGMSEITSIGLEGYCWDDGAFNVSQC